MRRTAINLVLDIGALLSMLGMVLTGIIVRYALPAGTGGRSSGRGWQLWGMGRHDWGDLHFYLAIAVVVLLALHVALHWAWVCAACRRMLAGPRSGAGSRGWRNGFALLTLALVVGGSAGFLYTAFAQLERGGMRTASRNQPPDAATESLDQEHGTGEHIRGSATLREAAGLAGVSLEEARQRCALPATVDPDQRVGRIARDHGMTMSALRERLTNTSAHND